MIPERKFFNGFNRPNVWRKIAFLPANCAAHSSITINNRLVKIAMVERVTFVIQLEHAKPIAREALNIKYAPSKLATNCPMSIEPEIKIVNGNKLLANNIKNIKQLIAKNFPKITCHAVMLDR